LAEDRAGAPYWDSVWSGAELADTVEPAPRGVSNYVTRRLQALFHRHIGSSRAGSQLIEIGCANSPWLSYFAKRYGFRIAGIDYSSVGCEKTKAILGRESTPGEVIRGDLFDPPSALRGRFDAAISQGVVEHFEDTAHSIRAIAELLAGNGVAITIIPNLAGLLGPLQRSLNRAVYDVHVPLTAEQLAKAHERAGLRVVASGYLVPVNFGICNLTGLHGGRYLASRVLIAGLVRLVYLCWLFDEHVKQLPETRTFAGSVYCVASKST